MNSKTKFIPGHVPSRKEMMDFVAGKLSPEDNDAMRQLAEKDPFIADAIEGLKMTPSSSFDRIDDHVAQASGGSSWGGGIRIFTLALTVGIVGAIVWWSQGEQETTSALVAQIEQPLQEDSEREVEAIPEALQITEEAAPTEHHVVAHRSTDSSISVTISHAEGAPDLEVEHYVQIGPLPDVEPSVISTDDEGIVLPKRQSERIYHIEDYKVVDYRGKRSDQFKQWEVIPGGVPANQESADQDPLHQHENMEIVAVAYVDYLEEAIVLFSTQKFKDCSKRLKTILNKYPDDINAQFYLGLAQYNLGKDKKAKARFSALKNQGSLTFDQEIDFYLAKTMLTTSEIEEGKLLLETIAGSTSFYATQAQRLLAELN